MSLSVARARSYVLDAVHKSHSLHPVLAVWIGVRPCTRFRYSIVRERRNGIAIPRTFSVAMATSLVELNGFEPSTSGLQSPRSPS